MGPRSGLDDMEKRKFLTVPGLELRSLGRPARSQSLYRLKRKCKHRTKGIKEKEETRRDRKGKNRRKCKQRKKRVGMKQCNEEGNEVKRMDRLKCDATGGHPLCSPLCAAVSTYHKFFLELFITHYKCRLSSFREQETGNLRGTLNLYAYYERPSFTPTQNNKIVLFYCDV
jgi:hypothetical protein